MNTNRNKLFKHIMAILICAAMIVTYMPTSMLAYANGEENATEAVGQLEELQSEENKEEEQSEQNTGEPQMESESGKTEKPADEAAEETKTDGTEAAVEETKTDGAHDALVENTEVKEAANGSSTRIKATANDKYQFDHNIDKKATDLDSNYETEVTLSLPSAEYKLETYVVFAIDKSSYSDGPQTIQNAMNLLDQLKKSKANVKVNVVIFNRTGHPGEWYDLDTQFGDIEKQLTTKQYSGGSNMHAGMLAAKEVLENISVPNERKYLVLISDGSTYLHCNNGDYTVPYTRAYTPVEKAGGAYAYGGYWDEGYWNPYVKGSDEAGNVRRPKNDNVDAWTAYLNDVKDRNDESNGDKWDFKWLYYDGSKEEIVNGYNPQPRVLRSASNTDISYLRCYETWQELEKYNTYSIYVKDNGTTNQDSAIGFMRLLNGGKVAEFDKIQSDILYLVSAGTTIEDYMGYKDGDYNFDLVSPETMTIIVETEQSKQEYKAEKIADNRYGFSKNASSGKYDFEVVYTVGEKKGDEHLVWTINRNITNFERVLLKYKERLMNPKAAPGTYSGLLTNSKAVLYPISSNGEKGDPVEFPQPTVSYTVEGSDEPSVEPENSGTTDEKDSEESKSSKGVKTGDDNNLAGWLALMLIAGAGSCGILYKRRRED